MIIRLLYLLAAAGFASQAIAAELGAAPPWPNRHCWLIVAVVASLTLVVYAVAHRRPQLRLAVSAIVMAGAGRVLGWSFSGRDGAAKLSAAGVWMIVVALSLIVYLKARRLPS